MLLTSVTFVKQNLSSVRYGLKHPAPDKADRCILDRIPFIGRKGQAGNGQAFSV